MEKIITESSLIQEGFVVCRVFPALQSEALLKLEIPGNMQALHERLYSGKNSYNNYDYFGEYEDISAPFVEREFKELEANNWIGAYVAPAVGYIPVLETGNDLTTLDLHVILSPVPNTAKALERGIFQGWDIEASPMIRDNGDPYTVHSWKVRGFVDRLHGELLEIQGNYEMILEFEGEDPKKIWKPSRLVSDHDAENLALAFKLELNP